MPDRMLRDYLPQVYREVEEYRALLDTALQPEIESLWEMIGGLWNEQFIEDMSVSGLSRWEEMAGLNPADTVGERRRVLLLRLREELPFTLASLLSVLEELCGRAELEMDYMNHELTVRIPPGGPMAAADALLRRWLPANIIYFLEEFYLKHGLAGTMRHRELAGKTHRGIREYVN